jgi:dephospho-CoA kinase
MIIGLTGYARSGKDTVANILVKDYGFTRIAFADPIRELLVEVDTILENGHRLSSTLDEYGWEVAKAKPEVRRLLQELGVGARKILGDDVWLNAALRKISDGKDYVITDVRFTNEADTVKGLNGQLWRIKRSNVKAINSHVSESDMEGYSVDQILTNNGTIEDLRTLVKQRMELK